MTQPATTAEHAERYIALGWGLCSIPRGTKGPTQDGWNTPPQYIKTPEHARAVAELQPNNGWGLIHSASGTCCIDVDHLEYFADCLAELGVSLDEVFSGAPRIVGRPGRDKAIFRLPDGCHFKTHKLVWPPQTPGEKPITVFEMRTGAVQDVLPPTMHPDTHHPYAWREGQAPWDLETIPELPVELVTIWRDWERFKHQLMAVCPWAQKPKPPKLRTRSPGQHGNVIGQFNQAHDVASILESHGYQPKGRRWLSPTSSSNLAGVVVFEDGTHCFSHHASDPLNDGHSHDAFSVFCMLVHRGDMSAAVADAAKILGLSNWPPEPVKAPAPSTEFIENSRKAKAANDAPPSLASRLEANDVPSELLTIPGVLGEVVDLANSTAPYPQPILAVQTALALASTVLGRRYCTTKNNWPSLYFVNVANSGMGKNHARDVVEAILESAEQTHLIGPPSYTSSAAIMSALLRQPCCISIMDEFGDMLAYASAKGNHHKGQTFSTMKDLWGNLHGTHRPDQYSTMSLSKRDQVAHAKEERFVRNPALTVLGMTTPKKFYGSLTEDAIEGGFLNRLIIAQATAPRCLPRDADPLVVPASITEWCRAARAERGGNLTAIDGASTMAASPVIVDYTREALALLREYSTELVVIQNKLDAESDGMGEMQGRSREKAMRLALHIACSLDIDRPMVTAEAMRWAIAYVRWTTDQTIDAVRRYMTGGAFGDLYENVLALIKKAGQRGMGDGELSQVSRKYRGTEPRMRDQLMKALVADGHVSLVEFPKPKKGPSRRAWVFVDFCHKVDEAA